MSASKRQRPTDSVASRVFRQVAGEKQRRWKRNTDRLCPSVRNLRAIQGAFRDSYFLSTTEDDDLFRFASRRFPLRRQDFRPRTESGEDGAQQ